MHQSFHEDVILSSAFMGKACPARQHSLSATRIAIFRMEYKIPGMWRGAELFYAHFSRLKGAINENASAIMVC